jgi:DNA damage-binding protein 1
METHYVRLIEDQTFEIISWFSLDPYENGCSIITCSFTDDFNVYYCVGTAYALPEESEPSKVSTFLTGCLPSLLSR